MSAIDALKLLGGPGSLRLLLIGSLAGVAVIYFWPRHRRLGRAWLVTLFSSYLVLGVPLVAKSIAAPFGRSLTATDVERVEHVELLVIFDGDNWKGRIRETLLAWRKLAPSTILVSGENWFVRNLTRAGLPATRLTVDRQSSTTREQVNYLETFLRERRPPTAALIVSRLQAPRVAGLLDVRGLPVTVIAAPLDTEMESGGIWAVVPTFAALQLSRDALYERVALSYYRWRGWIPSSRVS